MPLDLILPIGRGYAQSAISVDKQTNIHYYYTFTAQDMRFDAGIITECRREVKPEKDRVQIGVRHNLGLVGVNKTPINPQNVQ